MKDKYRILIITCWTLLIVYSIIKIFGGNYFELMSSSDNFISFSAYVDSNIWLKRTIACINTIITGYFVLCAVLRQKCLKWYHTLIFVAISVTKSLLQWGYQVVGYILDIVGMIIFPIIINTKDKWLERISRPIIGSILLILFQILSMFLANIALFKFNAVGTLEALLYSLEVYFCIMLYYFYSNNRKENEDGILGLVFRSNRRNQSKTNDENLKQ